MGLHLKVLTSQKQTLCVKPHAYDDTVVQKTRKDLPLTEGAGGVTGEKTDGSLVWF